MSENRSDGNAGFTRRRFIIGTVGVSAAAALGGTVVRAPRAMASGAPSGPPTTAPPLPTTPHAAAPAHHHGARTAAADLGQRSGPGGHGILERSRHGASARADPGRVD